MKFDTWRHPKIAPMALFAAGALISTVVAADDAAERKAQAQRLFTEGQAALDKGDNVTACSLMRQSLSLFAVANSLFNVAQCDERDGKLTSALEHWKRGMSLIDATDKRAPVVKKAIETLETRVPRVRIVVNSKHQPLDVLLDDELVHADELEAAMLVDPGKHVITVRKKDHADRRTEILLNERERTEVVGEPGEPLAPAIPTASSSASTPPPPPPPPPPPGPSPLKVGGFVALGVGAAGILGAAITGGVIVSNHGEITEGCTGLNCPNKQRPTDLIESQGTLLPVNAALWGIGLAGAAAGAVMLVLSSRNTKENKASVVTPLFLPGGGGIGLSGRF